MCGLRLRLEIESLHESIELVQIVEVHDELTGPLLATGSDLHTCTQMSTELPGQFLMLMPGDIHGRL